MVHNVFFRKKKTIPAVNTKRTQTEIFVEILELCRQPTVKTRIMYQTNMSYATAIKFLDYLQKLDLLKLAKNGKKYETTEKGFEYIKKHSEILKLFKP